MPSTRHHAIDRARRHAPFLDALAASHPGDIARFADSGAIVSLEALGPVVVDGPIAEPLRRYRQRLALLVALGDLSGELSLTQVTRALSDFADAALDRAIAAAIERLVPGAPVAGFTVLALGKLGSHELNYSSDIDLILLYDPVTVPRRARDDPAQAALRIARDVVETIAAQSELGRVFRIDLRLRPTPEVTPIALGFDAALSHYETHALAWERAAFIRARLAAGDRALGERFLAALAPFVWRRALDFGQVREIGRISERIRDHYATGRSFGPGYDLKRGRGGIREAEFFAQTHQLIHGGREPALRLAATRPALTALAEAGIIAADAAATLSEGYTLLRTIEHRLQMIDDRQTHSLPDDPARLDEVARLHGLDDGGALLTLLAPPVEAIGGLFDTLIDSGDRARLPRSPDGLIERFADAGFDDPARAGRIVEDWRARRYPSLRSGAAQEALEDMLAEIVDRLAAASDPAAALLRLDAILARLPSSLNLFHLLEARPRLLDLLSTILAHAPTLAQDLGERSDLLDGLIDPVAVGDQLDRAELAERLDQASAAHDYEQALDRVRAIVGEYRFATGAGIIAGDDPIDAMRDYAAIAEAATQALARRAIAEFAGVHGRVPNSELVILALGRFGGRALTHASDLDVVFLFTGDFTGESDGPRPLGATRYYNRLAQRVIAALSVQTATGGLYDVDTRLRPSGVQGPLCVSVDSFLDYQRSAAWTWEHMALTRGRTVFGSAAARASVDQGVRDILLQPRDRAQLIADALTMRHDIARSKPPRGPFDAKLIDGGLVDFEFALHCVQLRTGIGLDPDLGTALASLIAAGEASPALAEAHDLLTRLLVTLRLVAPSLAEPATTSQALIARACGQADWPALLAAYGEARLRISKWWAAVSGSTGRGD
jgi:glutamate-ammonia-ligase adenylyltransferase